MINEYGLEATFKRGYIEFTDDQGNIVLILKRHPQQYKMSVYKMISDVLDDEGYDITKFNKEFLKTRKPIGRRINIDDERIITGLAKEYMKSTTQAAIIARICDETLDRSGQLLGEVRKVARKELYNIN